MSSTLFGLETEYAFTALSPSGRPLDNGEYLLRLMAVAERKLSSLRGGEGRSANLFLANGSRLYIDCGNHPELSTPECTTPEDAIKFVRAGERILSELAKTLTQEDPQHPEILLAKCNVDYVDLSSTWGCHESYLYRKNKARMRPDIIPHLVSRIVYCGAGGLNTRSPGIEFSLAPRVGHIESNASRGSTSHRGIFHLKDVPLCDGGFHRLHIICGESLCSQSADYLRIGTTALVVALIDAGIQPGRRVSLKSPVTAMHRFAADIDCTASVKLSDGGSMTAIEIQRFYLDQVVQHLDAPFMPPWAGEVCTQWREILDLLEARSSSLNRVLDWPLKLSLFKERARLRGIAWESLPDWTGAITDFFFDRWKRLKLPHEAIDRRLLTLLINHAQTFSKERRKLVRKLNQLGLSQGDLDGFLLLRAELAEIDKRFGLLGPTGIFTNLDQQGVLNHRLIDEGAIADAVNTPPSGSRARIRGRHIKAFTANKTEYQCDWQGIYKKGKRIIDLSDPFHREVA